jgi:hypothetical protein
MARTAVTPTALTKDTQNAVVLASAGVAIDATNSHVVTPPAGYSIDDLELWVYNTTASTKTATVVAGDNPPALGQSAGDLVISLTDGSTTPTMCRTPLSSGRFSQSDGTVNVDIAASMTGRIAVYYRTKG